MNCCYFDTTFLIEDIDAPKGFEYVSRLFLVKLLVAVKSILRINVIKNGILFTKNISIVSNTYLLSFKNSLGTLMRSSVTKMGFLLVVFHFR